MKKNCASSWLFTEIILRCIVKKKKKKNTNLRCLQTTEHKVQMKVKDKLSDNCHKHGHILMATANFVATALLRTGRRNIEN
jgi:hypothetical protein